MSGRGSKGKGHAFPGDLIALGAKPGAGRASAPPPNPAHTAHAPPVKKMKGAEARERLGRSWENVAEEVEMTELVATIEACYRSGELERPIALVCGAVKLLRASRAKPDPVAWMSLVHLAKRLPDLLCSEPVREALCSLLKRDVRESFKSKGNCLVSVLAANVLYSAFQDASQWPEQFLRVYLEDAIGERVWVDQPECRQFVENILTAFNTILPPSVRSGEEGGALACPSPPTGSSSGSRTPTRTDEEIQVIELPINKEPVEEVGVTPRYSAMPDVVEQITVGVVKEQLNRRTQGQQSENITRNFIRLLTFATGLAEIRLLVASKLEMWLINPKISRSAQELLKSVCLNCVTNSPLDVEVMVQLIKQRLKTKQTITLFLSCLKDLCNAHPDNLATILKHTIFNELSNARNPNNMAMLGEMFRVNSEKAAGALAIVFLELLLQKECYLRALRILLREIVRCVRHDINLGLFCTFMMTSQLKDRFDHFKEFEFKERMFTSLVDLITQAIFLTITPQVREAFSALSRGDRKCDITAYKTFLVSVSAITRDTVWWLHDVVPKLFKPDHSTYSKMLYKSLFMTPTQEEYFRMDGFPSEADRPLVFKLTAEVPVQQETLLRIFLIGMSKSLPTNGQDCLTIAETLINRAAGLHVLAGKEFPILSCDKAGDFMECVWQLTAYTFPESISLPQDYKPPSMAITASYWKAWQMLLIMTAHNPEEFGTPGWKSYPTLRALMEMCITNQFVFPPPTTSQEQGDEMRAQELQVANLEKQQILEFESQLAAASSKQLITEQSSLLLSTIIGLSPRGPLRRPPQQVLDQLKQLNTHYKIGHLLCRSRKPDFLLDILQRQGSSQAMPWLADLVENSEGSFSVLPVQCLCEFLLNDALAATEEETQEQVQSRVRKRKAGELVAYLQHLLHNPASEAATCLETLDYFLARLRSEHTGARLQALAGLRLILETRLGSEERPETAEAQVEDETDWLTRLLPGLPCFPLVYTSLASSLRRACQVETDPATVSLYIRFLASTCPAAQGDPSESGPGLEELAELVLDMASLIVERSGLLPAILPQAGPAHLASISPELQQKTYAALLQVFWVYMFKVRQQDRDLDWSESQDLINVLWPGGESATLHILVVHAQIILLTFGNTDMLYNGSPQPLFSKLLEMWFPPGGDLPRAYLMDTSEEALLIQDWLKLKMIRSCIPVLVDSALRDLEPQQLVLFIQSFGIPVESMTKLLHTLDTAVTQDLEAVSESVLDKAYMGQLVAVQHNRGAQGGWVFARALDLDLSLAINQVSLPEVTNILPELVIPPRPTALIPPAHVKTSLLQILEVGPQEPGMTTKERQDSFRTLQKFLAEEISDWKPASPAPMLEATLAALQSILQTPHLATPFLAALLSKTPFSVGLLRLMTSGLRAERFRGSDQLRALLGVCRTLLTLLEQENPRKPLVALIKSFVKEVEPVQEIETSFQELDLAGQGAEEQVKLMAQEALGRGDTRDLVQRISGLLLQSHTGATGLLVDWLELLDPTIISSCPELQMKLVFGQSLRRLKGGEDARKGDKCRPYLLSLLTHQASYSVLRSTVASLLARPDPDLAPGSVLDFLSACVHIPRLWQGRDQRPPKHDRPEDVLALEAGELVSLTELVIKEATESGAGAEDTVRARLELMLRCLASDEKIARVVGHLVSLLSRPASSESRLRTVRLVLVELYHRIPGCFNSLLSYPDLELVTSVSLATSGPQSQSVLDTFTHTLLSALAATQPGKHWAAKMQVNTKQNLWIRNIVTVSGSGAVRPEADVLAPFSLPTQPPTPLLQPSRPHSG